MAIEGSARIDEKEAWVAYRQTGDKYSRSRIIALYEDEVRKLAAFLYKKRANDDVPYEDYYQFGVVGMLESLERFEPDRGVTFATYAGYRIKGAILNGISKMTERNCRRRLFLQSVTRRKEGMLSNIKDGDLSQFLDSIIEFSIAFFLEQSAKNYEKTNFDLLYSDGELSVLYRKMGYYVKQLPIKQNLVISYHYFQQLTFYEIGLILELSESRISQLHLDAMQRLKQFMENSNTTRQLNI